MLSAGFSVFELILEDAIYSGMRLFPSDTRNFREVIEASLFREFHGGILNYWIVLGLQWGVLYYHCYRERSEEVLQIQLRASELQSNRLRRRVCPAES